MMTAFFVGLDLAQPQESTALAVLARQVVSRQTEYAVRHLQRWPPGASIYSGALPIQVTSHSLYSSDAFADQHRHPAASASHYPVVVTLRLTDDVDARKPAFVVNQQAADALADAKPHALVQPHRRRDDHRLDTALAPAVALDGIRLRPGRAGQLRTLAAAVAPANDFQPAVLRGVIARFQAMATPCVVPRHPRPSPACR